jgi:hypothetical protein
MIFKLHYRQWCGFFDFSLPLEDCQYEKASRNGGIGFSCADGYVFGGHRMLK